jgi:hypothetical protein
MDRTGIKRCKINLPCFGRLWYRLAILLEYRPQGNMEDDSVTEEAHLDRDKLVELMTTQSEEEANIVKGILEGLGINCVLVTQVPHSIYPFTVDGLAAIRIKVLDSQLEAAQAVLRDYETSDEPLTDDDPEEGNRQ